MTYTLSSPTLPSLPALPGSRFAILRPPPSSSTAMSSSRWCRRRSAMGLSLAGMKRLGDAVTPENLDRALMFLHERAGGLVNTRMVHLAMRARVIAEWCKLPSAELERLGEIFASVKEQSSSRRGMTRKNRALLDRLDDQRFNDLVHLLPQLLFSRANACPKAKWAPAMVRTALAIELLLTCSMRRENLVTLELDRSIRRVGRRHRISGWSRSRLRM